MGRSVVAARDIFAGKVQTGAGLDAKRSGVGISVSQISDIIGKPVNPDIEKVEMLKKSS